ncbi:MAG: hypothetical protein Q7S68_02730 [Deltaproteobacteria bacterium]|nr:hypothetical protein [Deltaproteobacteria bacterium]
MVEDNSDAKKLIAKNIGAPATASKAPFSASVITVETGDQLNQQLAQLKEGQVAVITFSSTWSGLGQKHIDLFDRMALEDGGARLWIRTENQALAKEWGVTDYPTVFIIDQEGNQTIVNNPFDFLKVLERIDPLTAEKLAIFSNQLANMPPNLVIARATHLAANIGETNFSPETQDSLYSNLVASVEEIPDLLYRVGALATMAETRITTAPDQAETLFALAARHVDAMEASEDQAFSRLTLAEIQEANQVAIETVAELREQAFQWFEQPQTKVSNATTFRVLLDTFVRQTTSPEAGTREKSNRTFAATMTVFEKMLGRGGNRTEYCGLASFLARYLRRDLDKKYDITEKCENPVHNNEL